jgi:hypothetical protein
MELLRRLRLARLERVVHERFLGRKRRAVFKSEEFAPFGWSPLNVGKVVDAEAGKVEGDPSRRKVAILGGSRVSRYDAPLEDPSWEVWALNAMRFPDRRGRLRADRYFELHPESVQTEREMDFYRACPTPIYTFDVWPSLSNSVRFPLKELDERWAIKRNEPGDLFACSFAYMVLLAMDENFAEIGLFGVDLDQGSAREKAIERTTVAYWLGMARGLGYRVTVPRSSTLLTHAYRYGYEYHLEKEWVEAWLESIATECAPWEGAEADMWRQTRCGHV